EGRQRLRRHAAYAGRETAVHDQHLRCAVGQHVIEQLALDRVADADVDGADLRNSEPDRGRIDARGGGPGDAVAFRYAQPAQRGGDAARPVSQLTVGELASAGRVDRGDAAAALPRGQELERKPIPEG